MIKAEWVFPGLLCIMDLGAGVVYLAKGNPSMFVYWVAACTLTAIVTWGK